MSSTWRNMFVNAAIVVVSLTVSYLVFSFITFRILLPNWSLNVRPYFTEMVDVLVQNSKAGYVPHDYIALLGDSYAAGHGDWLLSAKGNRAKDFHSAHVLHDLTGRDVITLGRAGAGSAQAMVRQPSRVFGEHCFFFPKLEAPRQVFVYFYEGNDLYDNIVLIQRVAPRTSGDARAAVIRHVEANYTASPRLHCLGQFAKTVSSTARFLISYRNDGPGLRSASNRIVTARGIEPTDKLQQPGALDAADTELALWLFDYALAWLQRNFPTTVVTMVYLPAPASIYRYAVPWVETPTGGGSSPEQIYTPSQKMCQEIRALSLARGVRFIDMRPFLRAAAAERPIHGPRDWEHFNEVGYRALGQGLARMLDHPASTPCRDWGDGANVAAGTDSSSPAVRPNADIGR